MYAAEKGDRTGELISRLVDQYFQGEHFAIFFPDS